jgi:adenosine deaminase
MEDSEKTRGEGSFNLGLLLGASRSPFSALAALAALATCRVHSSFDEVNCGALEYRDYSLHLLFAIRLARTFLPEVRLGHATGIAKRLRIRGYGPSERVLSGLRQALDAGLALEVNLTSNFHLLGIPFEDHPLRDFLRLGWSSVLGTDDPSVWRPMSELRDEFRIGIENGLIERKAQLTTLVSNSIRFSFLEDSRKAELSKALELRLKPS